MKFLIMRQNKINGIIKTKDKVRLGFINPINILYANKNYPIGITRDKEGIKKMGIILGGFITLI